MTDRPPNTPEPIAPPISAELGNDVSRKVAEAGSIPGDARREAALEIYRELEQLHAHVPHLCKKPARKRPPARRAIR